MSFTAQQVHQLLQPINTRRVANDGKGHGHVPQQDVIAHLIRMFGFGNFDVTVRDVECIFEHNRVTDKGEVTKRWDVGYRALVTLTVRDEAGDMVCRYDGGSTATAQNQTLGDAHDLAYKSALSLATKRAAIHLGDQFGLSLYNKGQTAALVINTLVKPEVIEVGEDVQAGVPQAQSDEDASLTAPEEQATGLSAALAKDGAA